MADVHPTATIDGDVTLADDVVVGPQCTLTGPITVGAGTRVIGHAYLQGPLEIGAGNLIYPFACIGFAPQHARYDPRHPGCGVVIGDGNVFREGANVHRAFTDEGPTRIGDRNTFMVNAHAGHDVRIGNDCTLANNVAIGGHVEVADNVFIGGCATVHQFVRLGRGAMMSGSIGVSTDVAPFFMVTGINFCASVNLVGMRRLGLSAADVSDVRWVYATLFRRGHSMTAARAVLASRRDRPLVGEILAFIERGTRPLCSGVNKGTRG